MKHFSVLFCTVLFCFSCNTAATTNTDNTDTNTDLALDNSYYTDIEGWNDDGGLTETFLGRGLNIGNYLEGPKTDDYPLGEGSWTGGNTIEQSDFARIKTAGFKTVRIPVRWSDHTAVDSPYAIDAAFMTRVKEVVNMALDEGFVVVMNVHHYEDMMNDPESSQSGHITRLDKIWDQICTEFPLSSYPEDKLVFELLNEPNGTIDYDDWNTIIATLVNTIWNTNSSDQNSGGEQRKIMIGTANWGHPDGLAELDLPAACTSSNTIMTIHYYEPFHFTHQGAEWVGDSEGWIGTEWTGTESDQAPLLDLYNRATSWNSGEGRGFEIFMGEFGVYSKFSDPNHQKAWTAFIAREAEKRDISWAYWEYDQGFGAYDSSAGQWKQQLIEALIPEDL